jgi:hypothetical protein
LSYDVNFGKPVSVVKIEHVVHVHEQPLDPFEQGKILEFNGEFVAEKRVLNSEAHAALFFDIFAQQFERDVFGRHGNPSVLYIHSRIAGSIFFSAGLRLYPNSRQARQTEKDQEKQEPWMQCLKRVIHEAILA